MSHEQKAAPPHPARATFSVEPATVNAPPLANRALAVLAACAIIALLHFGRAIVVPVILAALLCFAINPLVHALRRFGLGRLPAAFVAVTAAVAVVAPGACMIALIPGPAGATERPGLLPAIDHVATSCEDVVRTLQTLAETTLAPAA